MTYRRAPQTAVIVATVAALFATAVHADGRLVVDDAWIRAAPPGAPMRAGYAVLRNDGDAALVVRGVRSDVFDAISVHATLIEDGVARMRELGPVTLAPGERVVLEPGGKHLMLMRPKRALAPGDTVELQFDVEGGASDAVPFVVRDAAGADAADADAHAHH